jgi:hypothetical protein
MLLTKNNLVQFTNVRNIEIKLIKKNKDNYENISLFALVIRCNTNFFSWLFPKTIYH